MHGARAGEQAAVRVRRSGVQPVPRARLLLREVAEELPEVVGARARGVGKELVEEAGEQPRRQHPQVLGEQRPHRLEHELAQVLDARRPPVAQPRVHVRDERDRLAGELRLARHEHRLAPRQEEQRLEPVGQLREIERRPWLRVDGARLPHLEAVEGA